MSNFSNTQKKGGSKFWGEGSSSSDESEEDTDNPHKWGFDDSSDSSDFEKDEVRVRKNRKLARIEEIAGLIRSMITQEKLLNYKELGKLFEELHKTRQKLLKKGLDDDSNDDFTQILIELVEYFEQFDQKRPEGLSKSNSNAFHKLKKKVTEMDPRLKETLPPPPAVPVIEEKEPEKNDLDRVRWLISQSGKKLRFDDVLKKLRSLFEKDEISHQELSALLLLLLSKLNKQMLEIQLLSEDYPKFLRFGEEIYQLSRALYDQAELNKCSSTFLSLALSMISHLYWKNDKSNDETYDRLIRDIYRHGSERDWVKAGLADAYRLANNDNPVEADKLMIRYVMRYQSGEFDLEERLTLLQIGLAWFRRGNIEKADLIFRSVLSERFDQNRVLPHLRINRDLLRATSFLTSLLMEREIRTTGDENCPISQAFSSARKAFRFNDWKRACQLITDLKIWSRFGYKLNLIKYLIKKFSIRSVLRREHSFYSSLDLMSLSVNFELNLEEVRKICSQMIFNSEVNALLDKSSQYLIFNENETKIQKLSVKYADRLMRLEIISNFDISFLIWKPKRGDFSPAGEGS